MPTTFRSAICATSFTEPSAARRVTVVERSPGLYVFLRSARCLWVKVACSKGGYVGGRLGVICGDDQGEV